MLLKAVLVFGLLSSFAHASHANTMDDSPVSLPYEVEDYLIDLLNKTELDKLDTSSRSIVPIYRKDLDPNYIAYYEIDLQGQYYFVLSAGLKTGDYKEAQSGPPPLPSKVLRDQAMATGQSCNKFFLLTSIGLYMCENSQGIAVAATYDWINDAPVSNWKDLQVMVQKSLNDFEMSWKETAKSSQYDWKTTDRKQITEKPGSGHYDAEILSPGSRAKVALEENHGKITIHAIPESRQEQLCKILENVCQTPMNVGVNQNLIRGTGSGIKYLEIQLKADSGYVQKVLENKEISFYIKVETKDGQQILEYYSVDPSLHRSRRFFEGTYGEWNQWGSWSIKDENRLPDYEQHWVGPKPGGCWSGCTPVAWAMVLGYYDRMASHFDQNHVHNQKFDTRIWPNDGAPRVNNPTLEKYVEDIRKELGTYCDGDGGATTREGSVRINDYLHKIGINAYDIVSYWPGIITFGPNHRVSDDAAGNIKSGYPVVLSIDVPGGRHSVVATKLEERWREYRACLIGSCSPEIHHERKFYMHMGWGGASNGWKTMQPKELYAFRALIKRP